MKQPFILMLYGPMLAGKSTVAKALLEDTPNLFRSSVDKIKWSFSQHGYDRATWRQLVTNVELELDEIVLHRGWSVLVEGGQTIHKGYWKEYEALAKRHGVPFLEVNLEADWDTLCARLKARVEGGVTAETNLQVTSPEDMRIRYDVYREHKKVDIPTVDTGVVPIHDTIAAIKKLLLN